MLRPTLLRYVALACCDRLAGALKRESLKGGIIGKSWSRNWRIKWAVEMVNRNKKERLNLFIVIMSCAKANVFIGPLSWAVEISTLTL